MGRRALPLLRTEIKNNPFVILSGGAKVCWHDVPFVHVAQITFKCCNFILFYFVFFSPRTCCIKACANTTGEGNSCSHRHNEGLSGCSL